MSKRTFATMSGSDLQPQVQTRTRIWTQTQTLGQNQQSDKGSTHNRPNLTLDDIETEDLRMKTLTILRTVPTATIQKAYGTLISFNDNVEVACWYILEQQQKGTSRNLQLNEFVDLDTRLRVHRLRDMFPDSSLQECYVAVRIAEGVLDDAVKHLQYMRSQRDEKGEQTGFIVDPKWMDGVRW